MPGSFFSLERHSGFFLACFLSFRCLAWDFFSIFARNLVVVRLDFGSAGGRSALFSPMRLTWYSHSSVC